MSWIKALFQTEKPIIAMCHLKALPGDPGYDPGQGMEWVVEMARGDLRALQEGGLDAVMFSNEASLPYLTKVEPITTVCMARVIAELRPDIRVPFGVNVLWDPTASIDLAVSTGGQFVREIFSGVYASDYGLWNTNCGEIIRHKHAVHARHVKLFSGAGARVGGGTGSAARTAARSLERSSSNINKRSSSDSTRSSRRSVIS